MSKKNPMNFQYLALLTVVTALAASCATEIAQAPDPAPRTPSESGAELEEIVVSGARDSDRRVGRQQYERVARSAESPAMANQARSLKGYMQVAAEPVGETMARLSSDEELWVIATPARDGSGTQSDDSPGSGAMVATVMDEKGGEPSEVALPLKHTAVNARIDGYVSSVSVRQQFENPFTAKIEAVYLFPLPEKAAVTEFVMVIGERKIRGILREKEEAQAIYQAAKAQGYQASLLVQHRPNVFEQKVANIEPGKAIDVDITYFHTLAYLDGWYSFVFPTVVGPRYNPPGHADPIVAVARGTENNGTQTTASYLRPDERSAHDISINVEIDAGVAIENLKSTHRIASRQEQPETASVQLAAGTTMPNRDFVLDFQVAGDALKSNMLTWRDPETQQGYFTLMLYPPAAASRLERRPMELVFVLDCSGSMSGHPLDQAKEAVAAAMDLLQEGDTFQIIRFSSDSSQLGKSPLPATEANIARARKYLASLNGSGGTEMIEGIKAALDFPHDVTRLRFVTFMTDGYIGNESDIMGAVHERIGEARIFSFGVGSSVNRFLMERMAKEGRGAVAYLGPQDAAGKVMAEFFARISRPVLTDIRVEWGGMGVSDVYPAKIPDLFVGRAVTITGKYTGTPGDIGIAGMVSNEQRYFPVAVEQAPHMKSAIPKLWARLRIADLADRQAWERDPQNELGGAIRRTALEYQLMSDYTSFVAVDTSLQTEGEYGVTVNQALPVPDGVRYDTTVKP